MTLNATIADTWGINNKQSLIHISYYRIYMLLPKHRTVTFVFRLASDIIGFPSNIVTDTHEKCLTVLDELSPWTFWNLTPYFWHFFVTQNFKFYRTHALPTLNTSRKQIAFSYWFSLSRYSKDTLVSARHLKQDSTVRGNIHWPILTENILRLLYMIWTTLGVIHSTLFLYVRLWPVATKTTLISPTSYITI